MAYLRNGTLQVRPFETKTPDKVAERQVGMGFCQSDNTIQYKIQIYSPLLCSPATTAGLRSPQWSLESIAIASKAGFHLTKRAYQRSISNLARCTVFDEGQYGSKRKSMICILKQKSLESQEI